MSSSGRSLAITGVLLQLAVVPGVAITVVGKLRAFRQIQESGAADAAMLSTDIRLALVATAIGLAVSFVGTVLVLIALFRCKYRAPWFYSALWVLSILWLFAVPVGTVLGIVVILHLIAHKQEFAFNNLNRQMK